MKTPKNIITALIVLFLVFVNVFSAGDQIFFDDFETYKGWIRNPFCTDNATTGLWDRENPEETVYGSTMQLGTTISGVKCLVTGYLAGSGPGSYDIDDGKTSVRSPDIVLPSDGDLTLSFYYNFAHYNNSSNDDYLKVKVVGSTTVVVFEVRGSASIVGGAWNTYSMSLNNFKGQTVYLLVEATDDGYSSLVEAAIEDVRIEKEEAAPPAADVWNYDSSGQHIYNINSGSVGIGKEPAGLANLEVENNLILGDKSINQFTEITGTSFQIKSGSDEIYFVEGGLAFKDGLKQTVIYPTDINTPIINTSVLKTRSIESLLDDPIVVHERMSIHSSDENILRIQDQAHGNELIIGTDNTLPDFMRIRPAVGTGLAITGNNNDIGLFVSSGAGAKVGIGTANPGNYKLAVNGTIGAKEVVVTQLGWSDHVFKENYNLKSIEEIEKYIKQNHHLEGIPTEKEINEKGLSVGEMQAKLLEKIEEMTLLMIKMQKRIDDLEAKQNIKE